MPVKNKLLKSSILPIVVIVLFILNFFNYNQRQHPDLGISKDVSEINLQPEFIKVFSFGLSRFLSAVIWTDTIQSLGNYRLQDRSKRSWFYHRLKTIMTINPDNPDTYRYGPILLSFVVDDVVGANELFEIASKKYPDNFWINYYHAFNLFFELGRKDEGITLFKKLLEHPFLKEGNKWQFLHGLVARFEASIGNLKEAFQNLYIFYKMQNDEKIKSSIRINLYSLKAEIDLECLNSGKKGCQVHDFDGAPYIRDAGSKWVAQRAWKKYRSIKSIYRKSSDKK